MEAGLAECGHLGSTEPALAAYITHRQKRGAGRRERTRSWETKVRVLGTPLTGWDTPAKSPTPLAFDSTSVKWENKLSLPT